MSARDGRFQRTAEPGEPFGQIEKEGIALLFAVVAHRDAGVMLFRHDITYGVESDTLELRIIDRLALLARDVQQREVFGRGRLPVCVVRIRPLLCCI